jgi:REP element-mobilizing transposase RayT
MELEPNKYYHLYNRANNRELLFRNRDNYLYFLSKYRKYLAPFLDTLAYCLMPDHFYFLVFVKSNNSLLIKKNIGLFLSSYTKAVNKSFSRIGSLFHNILKQSY